MTHEIQSITAVCPNLEHLLVACTFDPRYLGYVGDEALLAIASNCPKLSLLHLADTSSLANRRGDPLDEGYTAEDARISSTTLIELFSGLPLLEELVLDVCKNVRDSSFALEVLNSKCPKLKVLKLGQFHGICLAIGSQLDGIALCQGLESLSIKNCADLTDMGLIEIVRGCSRLIWDETLAGPAPDSGLGKLRKYNSFSASSAAATSPISLPPPPSITRSITIVRTTSDSASFPDSPSGSVTPRTPSTPGTPVGDFKKFTRRKLPTQPERPESTSLNISDWVIMSAMDR
ncbi:hypothetical protein K1719_023392 [Acacia pycnantha]|nr:hypothetical protein K1719_023392 [Acacia pycnantha]